MYWQTTIFSAFFSCCLKIASSMFNWCQLSINKNNNKEHLFFQKPIPFGCRRELFVCFRELCILFFPNLLQYTVMDRWQLDSKTERSLRCFLTKATWWIKCNYNYSKIEILLYKLAWMITTFCDFLIWPKWKNALFVFAVASLNTVKS